MSDTKNMMDQEAVFINQKAMGELILNNLFSEETEKFYNNCAFTSDRMAFMQGMNYAALLCYAKLEPYPAIIHMDASIIDDAPTIIPAEEDGLDGSL